MRISNGMVAFEFDARTGSLVQIEDLRTGIKHLSNAADGRLFRVFAPDSENWIDRYCDSHESPRPDMKRKGDALFICYKNLRVADGTSSGISATVIVNLSSGADEAMFTMELENHGAFMIHEVFFPWIGGWQGYPGNDKGNINCGSNAPLNPFNMRTNAAWNLLYSHRRRCFTYPYTHVPFCDISNGKQGISYNFYPDKIDLLHDLTVMDLNERSTGSHPSWAWVQRPFLKPGAKWTSGPVGIAPHAGDWHVAADKMRAWLKTWWVPPKTPSGLRGSIGLHNAYFRDFQGLHRRPLSDLPKLVKFGLKHGLDNFCVWDMSMLGLYCKAGTGDLLEDTPERLAELKRVLKEATASGAQVSSLMNLRLITKTNKYWKKFGEKWSIRNLNNQTVVESYPLRRNASKLYVPYLDEGGVKLCQSNPVFQKWALGRTKEVLDMGFNSLFPDQPYSEDYCFSNEHWHSVPVCGHEGVCQWIARLAEMVHRKSAGSYLIGEDPNIWTTQFCDLWWHWGWSFLHPEVFRYILPESIQSWVIDVYEHEYQTAKAFALGHLLNINVRSLELTIADVPEYARRVKQLAALRRKTEAFTVQGLFKDSQGLKVDTDASVSAYLYEAGNKHGIILGETSRTGKGGGSIKLKIRKDALGENQARELTLYKQDGSLGALRSKTNSSYIEIETKLGKWESAVIEVSKQKEI